MRFLLDENADIRLAAFLTDQGHDVATVVEDYPQRTLDRDLLALAHHEGRTRPAVLRHRSHRAVRRVDGRGVTAYDTYES